MARYPLLMFLFAFAACVIVESGGHAPQFDCRAESSVHDDGRCHCNSDCEPSDQGTFCLDEVTQGWAGGVCSHACKSDRDCNAGYICDGTLCERLCSSSRDCDRGRYCSAAAYRGAYICWPLCDENADCDNGRCNLYSGQCLLEGEVIKGEGLNAPCSDDSDCKSGFCSRKGQCRTFCDPLVQHCPEGGVCRDGVCETSCSSDDDAGLDDSDAGLCE